MRLSMIGEQPRPPIWSALFGDGGAPSEAFDSWEIWRNPRGIEPVII
jgi:hypothetical protein